LVFSPWPPPRVSNNPGAAILVRFLAFLFSLLNSGAVSAVFFSGYGYLSFFLDGLFVQTPISPSLAMRSTPPLPYPFFCFSPHLTAKLIACPFALFPPLAPLFSNSARAFRHLEACRRTAVISGYLAFLQSSVYLLTASTSISCHSTSPIHFPLLMSYSSFSRMRGSLRLFSPFGVFSYLVSLSAVILCFSEAQSFSRSFFFPFFFCHMFDWILILFLLLAFGCLVFLSPAPSPLSSSFFTPRVIYNLVHLPPLSVEAVTLIFFPWSIAPAFFFLMDQFWTLLSPWTNALSLPFGFPRRKRLPPRGQQTELAFFCPTCPLE